MIQICAPCRLAGTIDGFAAFSLGLSVLVFSFLFGQSEPEYSRESINILPIVAKSETTGYFSFPEKNVLDITLHFPQDQVTGTIPKSFFLQSPMVTEMATLMFPVWKAPSC